MYRQNCSSTKNPVGPVITLSPECSRDAGRGIYRAFRPSGIDNEAAHFAYHILHNKPEVERFSMHTHPPRTLKEWREQKGSFPRNFWNPLESFFLSRGYTLWGPRSTWWLIPPNDAPRTPDGFAYRTVYNEIKPDKYFFNMIVSPVALYYFQVSLLIEEFYSLPCTHDRGPRCLDPPNGHWCRPR